MNDSSTTPVSVDSVLETESSASYDYSNFLWGDSESNESSSGTTESDDYFFANWLDQDNDNGDLAGGLDDVESVSMASSSLNDKLNINFSGLSVSQLEYQPLVWNAQQEFTQKVLGRVYLVLPGVLAGVFLGVMLWVIFTLIMRLGSRLKKKLMPSVSPNGEEESPKVEMNKIADEEDEIKIIDPNSRRIPRTPTLTEDDEVASSSSARKSDTSSSGIGKSESSLQSYKAHSPKKTNQKQEPL